MTKIIGNVLFGCSLLSNISVDESNDTFYSVNNCIITKSEPKTLVKGCKASVIPEDVEKIESDAFNGGYLPEGFVIPESVTSIGDFSFYGNGELKSLTLSENIKSIGNSAFVNLKTVIFKGDTPSTHGPNVFNINEKELKIYVPCEGKSNYKSSFSDYADKIIGYTNVDGLYTYLQGLSDDETEDIAIFDTTPDFSKIKAALWENDTKKVNLDLSLCTGVTTILENAFMDEEKERGCASLVGIKFPDSVTSIWEKAFFSCDGLSDQLLLPKSITKIENFTFSSCSRLTGTLTIPDGVTSIGKNSFDYCIGLSRVNIPKSVTSIGAYAFKICSKLSSVICEAITVPTLDNEAFNNCGDNLVIYVPSGNVEDYKQADGWKEYPSKITAITE